MAADVGKTFPWNSCPLKGILPLRLPCVNALCHWQNDTAQNHELSGSEKPAEARKVRYNVPVVSKHLLFRRAVSTGPRSGRRVGVSLSPCRGATAAALVAASCGLLLSGCGQRLMQGEPQEAAYLADPDGSNADKAGRELFPLPPGGRWTYSSVAYAAQKASPPVTEQARVVGRREVGERSGTLLEWTRGAQVLSRSLYSVDEGGVRQIAIGKGPEVLIDPPLTVMSFPVTEGTTYPWNGELKIGQRKQPAQIAVRVTRKEPVETKAGKFEAFRVDTTLTLLGQGRNMAVPSVSWYAPGVGLVKQMSVETDKVYIRELTSHNLK